MSVKILFIAKHDITYKTAKDKLSILPDYADIDILQVRGSHPYNEKSYCVDDGQLKDFFKNRTYNWAVMNFGLGKPFLSVVKLLKQRRIPYVIIHKKYHQSQLKTFREDYGVVKHTKRIARLIYKKWYYSLVYSPAYQFVSSEESWLYDSCQLPPRGQTVLINHQDTDTLLSGKVSTVNEIYFLDSNLFAHPDFKVPFVDKHEYLSELKETLESVSLKLNLPYKIALHPYSLIEDYLGYFDEDALCRYKDKPVIPLVVLSEGSTLLESLVSFCSNAFIYRSKCLKPVTDKHKRFLKYGNKLMNIYGLTIINELEEITLKSSSHYQMDKLLTNKEIITSYLATKA